MSELSPNPQAGAPRFLAEYPSTNHTSGAVSIRNTEDTPNRGDRHPLENWSDDNKLQNTLLAAHSALYRTRSDIPAVRITRVTAPLHHQAAEDTQRCYSYAINRLHVLGQVIV